MNGRNSWHTKSKKRLRSDHGGGRDSWRNFLLHGDLPYDRPNERFPRVDWIALRPLPATHHNRSTKVTFISQWNFLRTTAMIVLMVVSEVDRRDSSLSESVTDVFDRELKRSTRPSKEEKKRDRNKSVWKWVGYHERSFTSASDLSCIRTLCR